MLQMPDPKSIKIVLDMSYCLTFSADIVHWLLVAAVIACPGLDSGLFCAFSEAAAMESLIARA